MRIDEIIQAYESALRKGEEPRLIDLKERYPEHANELQAYINERAVKGSSPNASQRDNSPTLPIADANPLDDSQSFSLKEPIGSKLDAELARSRVIGNYKLLQRIGSGGMGEVWMAEQERPVRRRVAIKLIRTGMDTKEVVARFEAERQALAMMDHFNIAKVLDGGTTEDGSPYFVMELVPGIPLTQYCDNHKLSIDDRLRLFIPICEALQHAHQKGVVHRDLKPSNILVTLYDGKPVPKVIDFGLAKALQHQVKLTDKTLFTEFGQVVGTLQYMSPEQAEMNALDIDTRTDIYSLGVLLYELLTGTTPIDADTLQQQAILKVLESIRVVDPPRPSNRLSSSIDKAVGVSAQRRIDPKKLVEILRGDLDWIVMKALEKDRSRRYATVLSFADDLVRYLRGDAIEARPPSLGYRIRKIARRHRFLATSAAVSFLLITLGVFGTSIGFARARIAADREASAVKAQEIERKAKEEAIAARHELETERSRAMEAQLAAEMQRQQAEAERMIAEKARYNEQLANMKVKISEEALAKSNFFLATARFEAGDHYQAETILNRIPQGYRHIEWNLLKRLIRWEDLAFVGGSNIQLMSFTDDGEYLLTYDNVESRIKIWNVDSGQLSKDLPLDSTSRVLELKMIDNDNSIMVVLSNGNVIVWDFATGNQQKQFVGPLTKLAAATLSTDESMLAVASEEEPTVQLWSTADGASVGELGLSGGTASSLAFDEQGKSLFILTHEKAIIVDTTSLQTNFDMLGRWLFEAAMTFSTGGDYLCGFNSSTKDFMFIDASSGALLRSIKLSQSGYEFHVFSNDGGLLAVVGDDYSVQVFEVASTRVIGKIHNTGEINCLRFDPACNHLIAAYSDGTIKVFDINDFDSLMTIRTEKEFVKTISFDDETNKIRTFATSTNANGSSTYAEWDLDTQKQSRSLTLKTCLTPSFSRESLWAFHCDDHQLVNYQLDAPHSHHSIGPKGLSEAQFISVSDDGKLALVSRFGEKSLIVNAETGDVFYPFEGLEESEFIDSATFSMDGEWLAVSTSLGETLQGFEKNANQGRILNRPFRTRVVNLRKKEVIKDTIQHNDPVQATVISAQEQSLYIIAGEQVACWNLSNGELKWNEDLERPSKRVTVFVSIRSPQFSRYKMSVDEGSKRIVLVNSEGQVRVIDSRSGEILLVFTRQTLGNFFAMQLKDEQLRLASSIWREETSQGFIKVFDTLLPANKSK